MRKRMVFTLALCLANAAFAIGTDKSNGVPSELISELNAWLDNETEYQDRGRQPQIKRIGIKQAEALHGVADRSGGRIRGLYDADTMTIYLTEPWSADNPRDISVLLHELVHHRQSGRHWYCEQAQEWTLMQSSLN